MQARTLFENVLKDLETEGMKWLRKLVEINSYTRNREGVNQVGEMCIEMFSPLGFVPRVVPSERPECGDHVFLTRRGKKAENILLVSHLDTVYPVGEAKKNNFHWREEGDLIYGPGVADIKGGTVLIYMILKALQSQHPSLLEEITWHLLLNANEEEGCEDFPRLARTYVDEHSLACLVYEHASLLEGGATDVAEARKGAGRFKIETFGRQAHSGSAHKQGASAIRELARKIETIENLTDYSRGITLNVGIVEGGVAINRVPDYARALVDLRTNTREDYAWGREKITALAGEGTIESEEGQFICETKVTELAGYPPWPQNPKSHRLAKIIVECGRSLDLPIKPRRRNGASDGSHFWDLVPTLDGLGPVGSNIHCSEHAPQEGKEQESVVRSSFVERALLNLVFLQEITA